MKAANHLNMVRSEHAPTKEKGRTDQSAPQDQPITERHFTTTTKGEARIDSRLIAQHLGIKHRNLFELVESHKSDFADLGILRFQTGVIKGRGQPEKYVLLNEDQSYLLLTYSRNTRKVCLLKLALVKAFRDARQALDVRKLEYLPAYHSLHDAISLHAEGSPNKRFCHMNANKELNRLAGLQAGGRPTAGMLQQSLLAIGSALAARALIESGEVSSIHQAIKTALKPLENLTVLEVTG